MHHLLLPLKTVLNPQLFNLVYNLPLKVNLGIFTIYLLLSSIIIATYFNFTLFPQVLSDIDEILNSASQNIPQNAVFSLQNHTLTTKNIPKPYLIYPQNPLTFFDTEKVIIIDASASAETVVSQDSVILLSSKAIGINTSQEPLIIPYSFYNQDITLTDKQLEQTLTQYQTSLDTLITHRYWLFPLIQFITSLISLSVIALIYALPLTAAAIISRRPRRFKGWLSTTLIALSITQVIATAFVIIYGQENPRLLSVALTVLLLTALYVIKDRPLIILKRQPEKSV